MPHVTEHTVKARLAAWKNFFQTGQGGPVDVEYGDDPLVDMAFKSPSLELQDLAVELELEHSRPTPRARRAVSARELHAALAG